MTSTSRDAADAQPFSTWTEPLTEEDRAEVRAEEAGTDPSPQQVMEYMHVHGDDLGETPA